MADWSPAQYLQFEDERTRPARDLLAQVDFAAPASVFDLGCGPGNSTALLTARFPGARVVGVDNSPAMLAAACAAVPTATFIEADLAGWAPQGGADLLFANATLQWLPDHLPLMLRLLRSLNPGGALAVQMPDNLDEPSHALMRETAGDGPWAEKLRGAAGARAVLPAPLVYYAALKPHCRRLDIWHSIYNHPLKGVQGIVDWVTSTGLRPFLSPLTASEREAFTASYAARLARAYPALDDASVVLRFPRLFLVAAV